jgi:hypothetical protein
MTTQREQAPTAEEVRAIVDGLRQMSNEMASEWGETDSDVGLARRAATLIEQAATLIEQQERRVKELEG